MFKVDQKICQDWATRSYDTFFDIIMFVSVSIRLQTDQLELAFAEYKTQGELAPAMFGFKKDTLKYMKEEGPELYRWYKEWILRKGKWSSLYPQEFHCMSRFLYIPGIGMAKAGFITQLLIGKSWCADTNNLEWFGVDYKRFNVTKTTASWRKTERIWAYLKLGEELGGSAKLWNNWCKEIAKKYPKTFKNAQELSELHWKVHDSIPY